MQRNVDEDYAIEKIKKQAIANISYEIKLEVEITDKLFIKLIIN